MKYLPALFVLCLFSCNSAGFEADDRQIIAKDLIVKQIPRARSFDIVAFKQDTVSNFSDTTYKKSLHYTLDFVYRDSANTLKSQRGVVIFAPGENTVLSTLIQDR
jgi:hypothetical protein